MEIEDTNFQREQNPFFSKIEISSAVGGQGQERIPDLA